MFVAPPIADDNDLYQLKLIHTDTIDTWNVAKDTKPGLQIFKKNIVSIVQFTATNELCCVFDGMNFNYNEATLI